MSTYFIDTDRQALRTTGIVDPVMQWVEDPTTGKRRQSDAQEADEQGRPLWSVEVSYISEAWGKQSTTVARVIVGAPSEPAVAAFETAPFEGLTVTTSVIKNSGQLRESWRAEGIKTATRKGSSEAA